MTLDDGDGIETAARLFQEGFVEQVMFYAAVTDDAERERARRVGHVVAREAGPEKLLDVVMTLLPDA